VPVAKASIKRIRPKSFALLNVEHGLDSNDGFNAGQKNSMKVVPIRHLMVI
jgi:hypothetical protein